MVAARVTAETIFEGLSRVGVSTTYPTSRDPATDFVFAIWR
jgi:hypothetical protein